MLNFGLSLIGLLTGQPCSVCRQSPDYRCLATPGKVGRSGTNQQLMQRGETTLLLYYAHYKLPLP